jgi:hypothetical protein
MADAPASPRATRTTRHHPKGLSRSRALSGSHRPVNRKINPPAKRNRLVGYVGDHQHVRAEEVLKMQ